MNTMTDSRSAVLFFLTLTMGAIAVISSIGTLFPHQFMMSNMMGRSYSGFFWPVALTTSIIAAIISAAYVIAFPGIRYTKSVQNPEQRDALDADTFDPVEVVMRVSKPDERAVLKVLKDSGGVCSQKDITYRTGLNKIKTHRIIARFAERGIVNVKKIGKTNEVNFPAWLKMRRSTAQSST